MFRIRRFLNNNRTISANIVCNRKRRLSIYPAACKAKASEAVSDHATSPAEQPRENGNEDKSYSELTRDFLQPAAFYNALQKIGISFYCGVPDSLLKDFCGYVNDVAPRDRHVITANEGSAIALATGYNLATQRVPLVYMQNSGIGNAVNPLISLAHKKVYQIPMLLLVGWRGEPGKRDEPQHVTQGRITPSLLATLGIPFQILPDYQEGAEEVLETARQHLVTSCSPYCLVARKRTFTTYKGPQELPENSIYELSREEAIVTIVETLPKDDVFLSTTGMTSRELYEHRMSQSSEGGGCHGDFLTVGSMGHASSIALGIAMQTHKQVICLDGDGAAIMHLGTMATVGHRAPVNYKHVILNNQCHDSVGGQSTDAVNPGFSFAAVAASCGYKAVYTASTKAELVESLLEFQQCEGPVLLEVKLSPGHRKNLGRPRTSPLQNKMLFQKHFL